MLCAPELTARLKAELDAAYQSAYQLARRDLLRAKESMLMRDEERALRALDAAAPDAAKGNFQSALRQISKARSLYRNLGTALQEQYRLIERTMAVVAAHPMPAALARKYAEARRRVAGFRDVLAQKAIGGMTMHEADRLHDDVSRLLEFVEKHVDFVFRFNGAQAFFRQLLERPLLESNEAIAGDIAAIRMALATAEAQASRHAYELAIAKLDEVAQGCSVAIKLKQEHSDCMAAFARVNTRRAVSALGHEDKRAVDALMANATEAEGGHDYAGASKLLDGLNDHFHEMARLSADAEAELQPMKTSLDKDTAQALGEGRRLAEMLAKRASAVESVAGWTIAAELGEFDKLIAGAEASQDSARAKALLRQTFGVYVRAACKIEAQAAFVRRCDELGRLLNELAQDPFAKAREELTSARYDLLPKAKFALAGNAYAEVSITLDDVTRRIDRVNADKILLEQLKASLAKLRGEFPQLQGCPPHLVDAVQDLGTFIWQVAARLDDPRVDLARGAPRQLEAAIARYELLKTRMMMTSPDVGKEVVESQLKAYQARFGTVRLNEFVNAFKLDFTHVHWMCVLEVAFNVNVVDKEFGKPEQASTKELELLFMAMNLVPEGQAKRNPYLELITRGVTSGRGTYVVARREVIVEMGPVGCMIDRQLCKRGEILSNGLVNPLRGVAQKQFGAFTLHEVGHSVDEHIQFTDSRLGNKACGGWRIHGTDLQAIAIPVAAALGNGITPSMVVAYLANGIQPDTEAAQAGVKLRDAKVWQQFIEWANGVRDYRSPWNDDARCRKSIRDKGFEIGGRVYHEAYPGDWVSYDLEARNVGVSGYQFRAPGEWGSPSFTPPTTVAHSDPSTPRSGCWAPSLARLRMLEATQRSRQRACCRISRRFIARYSPSPISRSWRGKRSVAANQ